jgi:hypothetical protein
MPIEYLGFCQQLLILAEIAGNRIPLGLPMAEQRLQDAIQVIFEAIASERLPGFAV